MASDWNRLLDRLLASPRLTASEYRLVLAIARNTLGWNRRCNRIGRKLLRDATGLDGRTFGRALAGLRAAGLVEVRDGRPGRGNAAEYELLLDEEKAALTRPFTPPEKRPLSGQEKAALERPRRGLGKERATGSAEAAAPLVGRVMNAYLAAGGSLELDEWRGALAKQSTLLRRKAVDERVILAAAGQLGREREFPGYLTKRAASLAADGGPCSWEGLRRAELTADQLADCVCRRCGEWRADLIPAEDEERAAVPRT